MYIYAYIYIHIYILRYGIYFALLNYIPQKFVAMRLLYAVSAFFSIYIYSPIHQIAYQIVVR